MPQNMPTFNPANSSLQNVIRTSDSSMAPNYRPQQFYDRVLLEVLRQRDFKWDLIAQKRSLPKNAGTNTINFRRITKLNPALTPLTEGVTPAGDTAGKEYVTATVAQYGSYMAFTDKVDFEEIDPIIAEYTKEQGYQAKETLDILVREVLVAGTQVAYAQRYNPDGSMVTPAVTARSGITSQHIFNLYDVRKMVRTMKLNHVRPAIGGDYIMFISPYVTYDLLNDPTYQKFMQYGNTNQPLLENEVGRIAGVRFVEVKNPKIFTGAGAGTPPADVHVSILCGAGALGIVDVEGNGNVQTIVKKLGSGGTEDPLDQRQTIGWKINAFGAVRLNELCIFRYEHAVSS